MSLTYENSKIEELLKRTKSVANLFKTNDFANDYTSEFAKYFFNNISESSLSAGGTSTKISSSSEFNYIISLLRDSLSGAVHSVDYDNVNKYLKATNNPSTLNFIKSDTISENDKNIISNNIQNVEKDINSYIAHQKLFFKFNGDTPTIGVKTDKKYRYYKDDNKIKYIFCTLRLIETFLDILSAYKNFIDSPENDGQVINKIIITNCINTNNTNNNENHGYYVDASNIGERKLKDESALLLYIKNFDNNPLLTSLCTYHNLNNKKYSDTNSTENEINSYTKTDNTFTNVILKGIFINKSFNSNEIDLILKDSSTVGIKDKYIIEKNNISNNNDSKYKIICKYIFNDFLKLIYHLKLDKRNEQVEALIAQLEIYKLSIYSSIYACNKLFNTMLENDIINDGKVRLNTQYYCILPNAITSARITINGTGIDGKLNDVFSEIYDYDKSGNNYLNYEYYTTYFTNKKYTYENSNESTIAGYNVELLKLDTSKIVDTGPLYIAYDNLPSGVDNSNVIKVNIDSSITTVIHYNMFKNINDNIYNHVNNLTNKLVMNYYSGTNTTKSDILSGGNNFVLEAHDIERKIYIIKSSHDTLNKILFNKDFDNADIEKQKLIIPSDNNYYTESAISKKTNAKQSYLDTENKYMLSKSIINNSEYSDKKNFLNLESNAYKIVSDYTIKINANNYNIKNIHYDENDNLVFSIYIENIKEVLNYGEIIYIRNYNDYNIVNDNTIISDGNKLLFKKPNQLEIIKKTPLEYKNNFHDNMRNINNINQNITINESKIKNYKTLYDLNKSKNNVMYNQYYSYLTISIIILLVLVGINFYPLDNSVKKLIVMICFGISIILIMIYFIISVVYIDNKISVESFELGTRDEKFKDFFTIKTNSSTNKITTFDKIIEFQDNKINEKRKYTNLNIYKMQDNIYGLLYKFEIYRRQANSGSAYFKLTELTENEKRHMRKLDDRLIYEKEGAIMYIDVLKYETLKYSILIKSLLMMLLILTGMSAIFLYINGQYAEIMIFITILLLIVVFCYYIIYSNSIVRIRSRNVYWGKEFETKYD
jgi:hypothetical protein